MVLTRALEKASTGQFLAIYVFGVFGDFCWGGSFLVIFFGAVIFCESV